MAIFSGWRITRAGILFILGVVVLVGLLWGGIWVLRERAEQARRDEAIKIAEQNLEDQAQTPVAVDTQNDENEAGDEQPAANSSDELPATGAETGVIVALGALTFAGASYAVSRRAVRELL